MTHLGELQQGVKRERSRGGTAPPLKIAVNTYGVYALVLKNIYGETHANCFDRHCGGFFDWLHRDA